LCFNFLEGEVMHHSLRLHRPTAVLAAGSIGRRAVNTANPQSKPYSPVSVDEAVSYIRSHSRVFVHSVAMAPQALIHAMTRRAPELRDVEVTHIHTEGAAPYADAALHESFRVNALFTGANVRKAVQEGRANFTPAFLSEIPGMFRNRVIPLDVALVSVSPPDRHGFCSLGTSVDTTLAAVEAADVVIAQINQHVPRTHGDGMIHVSALTHLVEVDEPLHEVKPAVSSAEIEAVGRNVAALIPDGACLQMGIGAIPDAVLSCLTSHRRLGIHTEMFSEGVIGLVQSGVVTNELKAYKPHKIVCGFIMGTKRLYDFVDDNPMCEFLDISVVNNPNLIKQNDNVHAINSCVSIDLTGQVNADSIGPLIYSGVGGQMDFMRGAALSKGGKPIMAFTSTTKAGQSRIVPMLAPGAGVVTTRSHVHWVVTEYGARNLHGMSIAQRQRALIDIAHPMHRPWLESCVDSKYWLQGRTLQNPLCYNRIPESATGGSD
jgi:4-hydroxybutyrate CoA-transferase